MKNLYKYLTVVALAVCLWFVPQSAYAATPCGANLTINYTETQPIHSYFGGYYGNWDALFTYANVSNHNCSINWRGHMDWNQGATSIVWNPYNAGVWYDSGKGYVTPTCTWPIAGKYANCTIRVDPGHTLRFDSRFQASNDTDRTTLYWDLLEWDTVSVWNSIYNATTTNFH